MTRRTSTLFAIVLACCTLPARADLIVTFSNPTIIAGGTGTLDVFLSSTASATSPDMFYDTSLTLLINTSATGPTFDASQSYSYLNWPNYVFYGDSYDYIANPLPAPNMVTTSAYPNDTFIGSDSLNSISAIVSLSSSDSPLLLTSLTVDAGTSPGTYSVSLLAGSSDGMDARRCSHPLYLREQWREYRCPSSR